MGCHTWCYSHIPEKKDEWNKEYLDDAKESIKWMLNHLKNKMTDSDFQEYIDEKTRNNENWLSHYDEYVKNGKEDEYLPYFDNDIDKLHEYVKSIRDKVPPTIEEYRNEWIGRYEQNLKDIENCDNAIDYIQSHKENDYSHKFGLFKIHDGKMYRDTCHYRGPNYGEDYVFEHRYHDIFRIYNYEAKDCYSLGETLQRCEEHNLDWERTYENAPDYKVNDKDKLIEFWNTYPDSIIKFG